MKANRVGMTCLVVGLFLLVLTSCSGTKTASPKVGKTNDKDGAKPKDDAPPKKGEPKKDEPKKTEPKKPSPVKDFLPSAVSVYPKPEFTITATELAKEFKQDRKAWMKKYNYKVGEVTGTVEGYSSVKFGFMVKLGGIDVALTEETPWMKYPPGATIVVRGKVKNAGLLEVQEALVVKSQEGAAIPEYKPQELVEQVAKKFDPDNPGVRGGTWFRITGTVAKFDADYAVNRIIYLGAGGEKQVEVWTNGRGGIVGNYDHRQCRNLKPGDKVTFLARYNGLETEKVTLTPAFLVSPLPSLPALPGKEKRPNLDGTPIPHLLFTADQLAEWCAADPRALERLIDRHAKYYPMEVTGEVLGTKPQSDGDDIILQIKNSSQLDLHCVLPKRRANLAKLVPGAKITFRGNLDIYEDKAVFREPKVIFK